MKSYFIYSVIITWLASLSLLIGGSSAEAPNCVGNKLWCKRLETNESVCINPKIPNKNDIEDVMLRKGRLRAYTCHWPANSLDKEYRLHLLAPEGWRILLRVKSTRNITVKAGDGQYPDNMDDSSDNGGTDNEDTDTTFDSTEDRYFYSADHFVSRTNLTWVNVALNPSRSGNLKKNFSEVFQLSAEAAKIKDAVSTEDKQCNKSQMPAWTANGYYANYANAEGSLSIRCNNTFPPEDVLISFRYQLDIFIGLSLNSTPYNGFIQFVYNDSRNLITDQVQDLYLTYGYIRCESFWIGFNASGRMRLRIYNVTIQGLIYDEEDEDSTCPQETSPEVQSQPSFLSSTSPSAPLPSVSPPVSSSPASSSSTSSTTAEDKTVSSPANMATENFTSKNEGQTGQDIGLPSFLIPTVSVVAIFLLVSIVVLFICLKKRYHKRQSGNGDSVLSEDDDRHEYCDVLPSGKPSSNETTYDFADPSSAENGSGIKNASKDEGTANAKPNSHYADESESPYAENGVLVKGQGYVMVDMGKKSSQHQEKPKTSDNTGNDLEKNDHGIDEVKRSPTKNKVIVNGPEYAVVDMEKKASQRKEKAKISLNRGKDHPRGEHCMDQGESSTETPKVFMNGQEYAVVDMEKKALERKGKSKMGRSDEKRLETNDDETYFTLEPNATPEDKDGQTNQMNVKSPSGMDTADIHKTPVGESDYDEPQPFGSSSAEQYDELQFNPSVSDLSKKSDNQAKGESTDDAAEAYQTVSASTSPVSAVRPDSYPPSDYEAMSPPTSPGVMLTETNGQYPSSDNKTGGSLSAAAVEPAHRPLDTYQLVVQDQTTGNRDSSASHTYEDPAVMAEALERPYDKLQRGSDRNKPLATQKTISAADKEVAAMANHEDALNVYDEIATANATLKEADESSGAYQHLQRPHTKRSKAREPLPAIPGDEGYGRLNLEDNGASSHTNAAAHEERESGDSATKDDGPTYATVENPSEAYRPDDDDPAYDLLGTLK